MCSGEVNGLLLSFLLLFIGANAYAQRNITLPSPDRQLTFSSQMIGERPAYSIHFNAHQVIADSPISFAFDETHGAPKLHSLKPAFRKGVETYKLLAGKSSRISRDYSEVIIPLTDAHNQIKINWIIRVFNDGIAFRYEFISAQGKSSLTLTEENTAFRFTGNPIVRTLMLPSYTSSHEGRYTTSRLSALKENELMDMPTLFEIPGVAFVGITEAALVNYAGAYLEKQNGNIIGLLSPLPGQTREKVKLTLPHKSPWRVIMIGDKPGVLIESTIITDLAEPQKIEDASWLKPGKTTFPWWNGNVTPDTLNAPGNNFVTQQYYLDFCARNSIAYHSVVEYGLHPWYTDDGVGFQPGPHNDVTKPVPGLDMKAVCEYASKKGVGVRVWVHWAALYPRLDSAFAIFEQWGLKGMMIDFMDRDDQVMVNIQNEMLEKAAKHHLHIQFHGAYKNTGINRTWPNEFTREGTLNYEINKWDHNGLSPDDDIMIPFTRMLAGSTDYHLGGFRAVPKEKYQQQYTRPLMHGTRCHMLAMYIVLENYLAMVCDYPDAYEGQPGFDFLKMVPTVWDETKVIDSKVGEYIVIARRKGSTWYVGGITNTDAREVIIPLTFLTPGNHIISTWTDDTDANSNPDHLVEISGIISSGMTFKIKMAGGGGVVMKID